MCSNEYKNAETGVFQASCHGNKVRKPATVIQNSRFHRHEKDNNIWVNLAPLKPKYIAEARNEKHIDLLRRIGIMAGHGCRLVGRGTYNIHNMACRSYINNRYMSILCKIAPTKKHI
jgi:hypothetical protein